MRLSTFISRKIIKGESNNFITFILKIAIATISLGLCIMILSINIISGFESEVSLKIFDFWGHINIKDINSSKNMETVPITVDSLTLEQIYQLKNITYEVPNENTYEVEELHSIGGIRRVDTYISIPAILQTPSEIEGIVVKGYTISESRQTLSTYIVKGRWIRKSNDNREIILSRSTSRRMKRDIGDKVNIHFIHKGEQIPRSFEIVGIYNTGLEEFDKVTALTDISVLQEILHWNENQVGGVEVVLEEVEDLPVFTSYINYELLPGHVYAQSIKEQLYSIFQWIELQEVNKILILGLLIIICIINMVTMILILILERTQLIGVLKTLGAKNWTIRQVFLDYGAFILIRAIIIGNTIGLVISYLQYKFQFIKMDEENYYITHVPIKFEWLQILYLNLGTFIIVLLCLILPSMLITKIRPVKVLRFE